jgi:hypothetical protein
LTAIFVLPAIVFAVHRGVQKVSAIAVGFAASRSGVGPQFGGMIIIEFARFQSGSTDSRTSSGVPHATTVLAIKPRGAEPNVHLLSRTVDPFRLAAGKSFELALVRQARAEPEHCSPAADDVQIEALSAVSSGLRTKASATPVSRSCHCF